MRLYSSSFSSTRNSGERDNACLYSNYTPCCINFNLFLFLFSYNIYEKYMRNNRRIGESIICGRSACARNIFQKRENIPRQTEFHIPSNERAEESHTHSISIFIWYCNCFLLWKLITVDKTITRWWLRSLILIANNFPKVITVNTQVECVLQSCFAVLLSSYCAVTL